MKTPTMENRFRNFINTRRARPAEVAASPNTSGGSYHSSPSSTQSPTFLFKTRAKSQTETRQSGLDAMPLRSFSYESCQPGKSPTFGTVPQKGNGPIKLQTSRRLSSGELINIPQDSQRTLDDIREDGYIVGRKNNQNSPRQAQHSSTFASRPQLGRASYSAPGVQAPFSSDTWSQSPKSSVEDLRYSTQYNDTTSHRPVGLGVFQSAPIIRTSRTYDTISEYQSYSRKNSVSVGSTRSSVRAMNDTNATLKALRKAEYAKLVELCGSDIAAQNLAYFDAHQIDPNSTPVMAGQPVFSPVILGPLPLPPIDTENRRSSQSSSTAESIYSDSSSPQRASYVSSVATGQTSIEEDAAATREDIRKLVESMRHSYLSAIESREPTLSKTRTRNTRKNKHALAESPTLSQGSHRGSASSPALPLRSQGRQTWHPADADRDLRSQRRTNSHPPGGFGRLSPIEASPPRIVEGESALKRADSSTLGALMAEVTREQIRSRASTPSKKQSQNYDDTSGHEVIPKMQDFIESHPSQKCGPGTVALSPVFDDSDSKVDLPRKDSEDFDELFSDELWSTSTSTPSVRPLSLCTTYANEPSCPVTPRKKISYITSIPESPEYTHLATTDDPENNFI